MLELGTGAGAPSDADIIKEGSDATFMEDVIEASKQAAVIVDFQAEWCGPCKTLGPALEDAVRGAGGAAKLVKIDIDKNQQFAAQLRVQSIPAVFAFVNGQPVDGFMGAVPPSEAKAFVDRVAQMGGGGDAEAAVAELLELFRRDREWNDGAAKTQLFKIFESLGDKDPVALAGRRRLSSMIFM